MRANRVRAMTWLLKRWWFWLILALAVLAIVSLVVIGYELDKSMQYYYRNLPKARAHGCHINHASAPPSAVSRTRRPRGAASVEHTPSAARGGRTRLCIAWLLWKDADEEASSVVLTHILV